MDSYLPVYVTTTDGKTIDGVLLNEDGYSLQMIGNDQQLHLFDKAKLRKVAVEPRSLMPTDYDKRLTPDEFKDLMAFLTRQEWLRQTGSVNSPVSRTHPCRKHGDGIVMAIVAAAGVSRPRVMRAQQGAQITWTFDRLDTIGGLPVTVYGNPESDRNAARESDRVRRRRRSDIHRPASAGRSANSSRSRPFFGQTAALPSSDGFTFAERNPTTGQLRHADWRQRHTGRERPLPVRNTSSSTASNGAFDAFVAGRRA